MTKKKASKNNNNNNNNSNDFDEEFDSGEWINIPTKEQRQQENNEKRLKKKEELQKKRDVELKEHQEKQKRIEQLFNESSKAFSGGKNKSTPWGLLDEDVDDFEQSNQHAPKKSTKQQAVDPNKGFHYGAINIENKQKKKKLTNSNNNSPKIISSTPKVSLEKAIESFNFKNYYNLLDSLEKKYPSVTDLQIKYIAECLEEHFGNVESDTAIFDSRVDYLEKFDDKFKDETKKFFKSKPISNILPTALFLIHNILSILRKDKEAINTTGVGLEILLQLIFRYFPETLLNGVSSFKSMNIQSLKPNVISLFFWFFIQPINPHISLSIWLQLIFPVLYKNKLNDQVLSLFSKFSDLVVNNEKLTNSSNKDFVDSNVISNTLQDYILTESLSKIPSGDGVKYSHILYDLDKLFPSHKIPSDYFYVLLVNAALPIEQTRTNILFNIINCIKMDKNCINYLKNGYKDNIAQVNNILLYTLLKWSHISDSKISKESIYNLAIYCKEYNEQVLGKLNQGKLKTKVNIKEVEMANITCNSVIKSFKSNKVLKYTIYFILLPILAGAGYLARQVVCEEYTSHLGQKAVEYLC
ncbi:hypothetical protein CYY_002854 [Polysphondylium violaceum]|uniref:Uncharacterized protein n=1 Tax=Polysphondylium violaceum TaxID=133409 RepID=A0A8J4PY45_9MYCE|nr:hypothetical protein CYY_002854 [Polysphondylium violaceum]